MIINSLQLYNFRNYENLSLHFGKGLNVIVGPNGSGKTNIVEAIDMLSFGYSFRTRDYRLLIKNDKEKAKIVGSVALPAKNELEIVMSKQTKLISLNNKVLKRSSELAALVDVSTFTPGDVFFFDKEPAVRRKFLNERISKKDIGYLNSIIEYEKLLKERTALLKNNGEDSLLDAVDTQLSIRAQKIVERRLKLVSRLQIVINNLLKSLTNEKFSIKLSIYNSLGSNYEYQKAFLKRLKENREKDRISMGTTIGPHRDDLKAVFNGNDVKNYASQGQKRIIALAMKMAPYFEEEDVNKKPIIILDDVLSELDEIHQEKLINLLNTMKQVFITTTIYNNYATAIYNVENGSVTRR